MVVVDPYWSYLGGEGSVSSEHQAPVTLVWLSLVNYCTFVRDAGAPLPPPPCWSCCYPVMEKISKAPRCSSVPSFTVLTTFPRGAEPFFPALFIPFTSSTHCSICVCLFAWYVEVMTNAVFSCFAVRAGSVIFLVGVGSLVCWKLWEHWRNGADTPSVEPPTPPHTSPPPQRPRGILASLLEEDLVQDSDEYDDEDPAFIHVSTPDEGKGGWRGEWKAGLEVAPRCSDVTYCHGWWCSDEAAGGMCAGLSHSYSGLLSASSCWEAPRRRPRKACWSRPSE